MANYYSINEDSAKMAHDMMSMSDYNAGSKTKEYREMVDEVYGIAEKVAEKRPKAAEKAQRLADRYAKRLADNFNADSRIGCMCPSVLISGASNFPTKKKDKQVAAWERNHEDYKEVEAIKQKLGNMLYGKDIIKSGDDDAVERLQEKLDGLKKLQEEMKAANKAVRLKDTKKGDAALRELGYSDEQIMKLREPDFCGRVGYSSYLLSNNNANIRRIEDRLESLKAAKAQENTETEHEGFKIVENTEIMRLQIIFDGKPESDVRDILKSNGFRWAPSQNAWQRQLTPNAKYALGKVMERLGKMDLAESKEDK